jgi:RNA polymerase sigma factor (sigma-70 family)
VPTATSVEHLQRMQRSALKVHVGRLPVLFALLADERLARLVASEGESEAAFATIYERYHQPLYRYARSILHDGDDAHDALQSTLARAFAALQRGQRDAPLCPWLFRIVHNEAISVIRRRGGEENLTNALEQSVESAEDRAGARTRLAMLVADLRELPERQRGALLMREFSGLSYKEIAIALGISTHAVKHGIHEARRSLVEFQEGRVMACAELQRTLSDADSRTLRHRRVRAHLRDCTGCAGLAAAIPARGENLQALFPPLAPMLATGLLARLLGAGSPHTGASGAVASGVAGKSFGASFTAKALVGVSIMVATGAGVTGALALAQEGRPQPPATGAPRVAHAGSAASHGGRVLAAQAARKPHHRQPPAAALAAGPTGSRSGAREASSDMPSGGVSASTAADQAIAGEVRPARVLVEHTRKGPVSQRSGTSGRLHGGAGGRSGVRAQHPAARKEAAGVAGDHAGKPSVAPPAPGVGSRPSGHAQPAPEPERPTAAEGPSGPAVETGETGNGAGPGQPVTPVPPAPKAQPRAAASAG